MRSLLSLAIKNKIYILTIVDCKLRCILGWAVVWISTQAAIQQVGDWASKAKWYYSDGFDAINDLGITLAGTRVSNGKVVTYSVITLNYVIIWLVCLGSRVVFLAVHMRWSVPCAYLSFASIAYNFTNNVFQTMSRT